MFSMEANAMTLGTKTVYSRKLQNVISSCCSNYDCALECCTGAGEV